MATLPYMNYIRALKYLSTCLAYCAYRGSGLSDDLKWVWSKVPNLNELFAMSWPLAVLSHLLKHIRIFDILKEIVAGNNV
ncbi:hypothetical protein [Candidatus Bandiella euplotis]|uniref:hypothetical protein n=1 Tax=Candidatus Bandiella euplotis TaxID=1664265 RepID=UPI002B25C6C8|nr:hypothetical protein [Candidatus Bandiella woodruffii]